MKAVAIITIAAGLVVSAAHAQPMSVMGGAVCLKTDWIDHTRAPDNRTILFYMRDNKVWQTRLSSLCPQLMINGFVYEPTPSDHICGNLQAIKVIDTGAVCMMGPIVPYTPPPNGS